MRYAYYPGCSLHGSAKEYDDSWRAVCKVLGIELVEMKNWNCCGTVHATSVDRLLSLRLAARNLAIAEEMGLDMVAPCTGCYKNLRTAYYALGIDAELKVAVSRDLPRQLDGTSQVKHPLYVIVDEFGLDELADVPHPLHGLRVAPYYGCVLTRPAYLQPSDSSHYPVAMDHLLETLGAEVAPFAAKTKCCGGGVLLSHPDVAHDLTGKLLKLAKGAGAQCVAVACPMCHVALDAYQSHVERRIGQRLDLPILYFTQLMGMALGIEKRRLGLGRLMVSPAKVLAGLEDRG